MGHYLAALLVLVPLGCGDIPPPAPDSTAKHWAARYGESDLGITAPAHVGETVFGYADYPLADGPEGGSTFRWLVDGEEVDSGGTSTALLLHLDGDLTGIDGTVPQISTEVQMVGGRFDGGAEIGATTQLTYALPDDFDILDGTIELWMQPAHNSADPTIGDQIVFYQAASASEYVRLHLEAAVLYFESHGPGGWREVHKAVAWGAGEWHHVGVTFGEGEVDLVVDGQPHWPREYYRTEPGESPTFSLGDPDGERGFEGIIDEVRFHNRALTAAELHACFGRGRAYHDNELLLDLVGRQIGDSLVFEYTPCVAGGECGEPLQSEPVVLQEFISRIEVSAGTVLHPVNRDLLGAEVAYDETPVGETHEGHSFVWSWDVSGGEPGEPTELTAGLAAPLRLGLSRFNAQDGDWDYSDAGCDSRHDVENWKRALERMVPVAEAWAFEGTDPDVQPYIIRMRADIEQEFLDPEEAADLVDHLNVQQGLGFRHWETHNEPYGEGEGPVVAEQANAVAEAMKGVDPDIHVVVPVDWLTYEDVFAHLDPDLIDGIAIHAYVFAGLGTSRCDVEDIDAEDVAELYDDYMGNVENVAELQHWYRNQLEMRFPGQAMEIHDTEWNLHNTNQDAECDIYYDTQTLFTLGTAALRNHMLASADLDSAQFFKFSFSGGRHSTMNLDANPTLPYLVARIYADFVGDDVLATEVTTRSFASTGNDHETYPEDNTQDPRLGVPSLSVLATLSEAGDRLFLIVVNVDRQRDLVTTVTLDRVRVDGPVSGVVLDIDDEVADHPDDPMESITRGPYHNDSDFYAPEFIPLAEFTDDLEATFTHEFGAHSLTAFEFPVRPVGLPPDRDPPFGEDDDDVFPGDDDTSHQAGDGCSCAADGPRRGALLIGLIVAIAGYLRRRQ